MKTAILALLGAVTLHAAAPDPAPEFLSRLKESPVRVEDTDGKVLGPGQVKVKRVWNGDLCTVSIRNVGKESLRLRNIILFDLCEHGLDPKTPVYGEGFQKLAENSGTLSGLTWRGPYSDIGHHKIPEPDGLPTVYGTMTLDLGAKEHVLLAFTSCNRFIGRFSFDAKQLRISVDPEGLELAPGETWKLEEFTAIAGEDRNVLLDRLVADINRNHPPLPQPPLDKRAGWCTWYGVGGAGNQMIVTEAAEFFAKNLPQMKFIQIDEGYTMEGDLELVDSRWGDMKATADAVKAQGMLPAIWVGPFVADPRSKTLAAHPDWYVQGEDGKPLESAKIGYGGWKGVSWRVLDGSNPAACDYLEKTFHMMRETYGISYFKLDANYWGAIHGGKHFDPKATRVEAYRRGMEAVLRGAGPGAVILGCNAPMWPSLGLVNAMRTGNDLTRSFGSFRSAARENLSRGWQNGGLWVLDPDVVLLAGDWEPKKDEPKKTMPANIRLLHATVVHAAGGLVLSGDKIPDLGAEQQAILQKLVPPTGKTARFENDKFEKGVTDLGDRQYYYAFNWEKEPSDRTLRIKKRSQLKDFWTGEDLGIHEGDYVVKALPGQSARLIVAMPESSGATTK
jgi:alpha-galactosidase